MTRLLVSVRSVPEALTAGRGGADFIDLKEPGQGALGGLLPGVIRAIVAALRADGIALPVSATIGDLPMQALGEIRHRVAAVAACGVDIVKVGIVDEPGAADVLQALAGCGHAVVPDFVADRGIPRALVEQALGLGFAGVMADTADKRAGSLFEVVAGKALRRFVAGAREARVMVGLAGALRLADLPALVALEPDFAGFRSAVCAGDRRGALDAARLQTLVDTMHRMRRDIAAEPAQAFGGR